MKDNHTYTGNGDNLDLVTLRKTNREKKIERSKVEENEHCKQTEKTLKKEATSIF